MDFLKDEFGNDLPKNVLQYEGMVSLVVLSNTFFTPTVESLRASFDEVYPGHFVPQREDGNGSFVVLGEDSPGSHFLVKSLVPGAKGMFMLLTCPGPYRLFSDFEDHIADRELCQLAHGQTCWFSVDLIANITTKNEAYRLIATVVAHLAPADAAVLVHPGILRTIAFDSSLRRRLASGGEVFGNA